MGIVVRDIEKALGFYSEVLGWKLPSKGPYSKILHMDVPGQRMKYAMLLAGSRFVELIEPEEGTWLSYLEAKGEGAICELCVLVDDIDEAICMLEQRGLVQMDWSNKRLSEKFMTTPSGSKCFYLPIKETLGTLIEVLQRPAKKIDERM
ncbi:MAG: VOC family protein [Candidatus Thorarchaeota archaeon]